MRRPTWGLVSVAAAVGFLAGALLVVWSARERPIAGIALPRAIEHISQAPSAATKAPPALSAPAEVVPQQPLPTSTSDADLQNLRDRRLTIPVTGIPLSALRNTFGEGRTKGTHDAIDILAPRNTPVVAVEDGTIVKLFNSKPGGLTIYQFDPSRTYAYYYAHLERYADNVQEKQAVTRGQVIGYVGTSGDAPKDTPHLHFSIFKLTPEKQWWKGDAINPYLVWR